MTLHQFLMIVVMCACIIFLRAFPFIVFQDMTKKTPPLLLYLGRVLTAAAIAMLVVYSIASVCDFKNPDYMRLFWMTPAILVTILLQWFIKNSLISIVGGTAVYMICIQLIA